LLANSRKVQRAQKLLTKTLNQIAVFNTVILLEHT